ncbi:uncharacterized protein LOC133325078 [Musca vetustissima]|uniref:uncharacterized protein LOC133325078 n=1 Tax=Musca vetustissima TaxID=27455 RepID=UPI002AB67F8D|nr:uncharacterized protein LOC133325078 [Musca vetustissima]
MKFAVFALVAALCLVAVNANAVGFTDDFPTEFVPSDLVDGEIVDIETYHIFSSFWWITKAALKTLKGVNCSIKQVIKIRDAAVNFLPSIQGCGTDAVNAYANVITATQNVIDTCNAIIQTNEEDCNNDVSTDGKTSTPKTCYSKLVKQFYTLNKQLKAVNTAIKKVPSIPSDAADCANQAVNDLTSPMTTFTSSVKACSKLTS